MTNTPFSKKCDILAQAYSEWQGEDMWGPFFSSYDLGTVFAFGVSYGMITVTKSGENEVNEAWVAFCDRLGIDSYGDYDSIDELLDIVNDDE